MTFYDPGEDRDDRLPEGPKNETFSQKLRRLAAVLHGTEDGITLTPEERARRNAHLARVEEAFGDTLDRIFREREPGEEG